MSATLPQPKSGPGKPTEAGSVGTYHPKSSVHQDNRIWYDQFTSTDWVHDSIADGYRIRELQKRRDLRGRLWLFFDSAQGWILVALVGICVAFVAYFVDITESAIFDLKEGYCQQNWAHNRIQCCNGRASCVEWRTWSEIIHPQRIDSVWIDYFTFTTGCVVLATISCYLTLYSKTVVPGHIAATFDENLGANRVPRHHDSDKAVAHTTDEQHPTIVYYSAAGSGVAEVKVILSGFVLHGYLGFKTLILKISALILSVASGMSLGKEGPYVHIATCIGNIACRLFAKYNLNDGKRREILSASAASGVAVAFGAPLGGVLFSLEEVSYYFPLKTLFRTFFCCIASAICLKFLNPYGTSKIVLFQVRYLSDWRYFELGNFIVLGVLGGIAGALFIKASRFWAKTFRRIRIIRNFPLIEVILVALITGLLSFWNRYTKLPVTELLLELASPCEQGSHTGLCPDSKEDIGSILHYLFIAFVIKSFLTIITFGIKVPAGIYVPSMVVGGLIGRIYGHIVQYVALAYPDWISFNSCPLNGDLEGCVTPGIYALIAAGATMCGVTRLSVTLVVILFELTGSLDHVLPFSLAVLVAKWTADAVEPLSIYDLLTDMNSYPLLDNKAHPVFDSELGDICQRLDEDRTIDVTHTHMVSASELREKVTLLQRIGELDGGIPILKEGILVGMLPIPDADYALDRLEVAFADEPIAPDQTQDAPASQPVSPPGHHSENEIMCLLYRPGNEHAYNTHNPLWQDFHDEEGADSPSTPRAGQNQVPSLDSCGPAGLSRVAMMMASNGVGTTDPTDLTPYVDPSPLALDLHSPMDLVYQCFVKLGLRYICVLDEGKFSGMVHKKGFVRYVRELE